MRAARNLAAQVLTLTGARQFRALTVAPSVGIYPKLIKKMMTFFRDRRFTYKSQGIFKLKLITQYIS